MSQLCLDLVEQAEELVKREKKKPKQASVRRAISTCYYALFHFISDKVTREFAGVTHETADIRTWLGRALEHRTLKSACKCFGKPREKALQDLELQLSFSSDADLKTIADIFVDLQELRHHADYDLSQPLTRSDAQTAISQVRSAFALWNDLEIRNPRLMLIFCLALLHWNNLSKR